jgi:hypothetical protein
MQEFFDYLEYSISRALANSVDAEKRCFWCDGIMMPEIGGYVLQQVGSAARGNEQAWIAARAWIDNGRRKGKQAGQRIYEMKVILGQQALAAYQAGEDLRKCVPPEDKADWIVLDTQKSLIMVELL